jgi:hypothetical protein
MLRVTFERVDERAAIRKPAPKTSPMIATVALDVIASFMVPNCDSTTGYAQMIVVTCPASMDL